MSTTKIAFTINTEHLQNLDALVAAQIYPNRSKAIQDAIADKLARVHKTRLAHALDYVDPNEEQELAEEWLDGEPWDER